MSKTAGTEHQELVNLYEELLDEAVQMLDMEKQKIEGLEQKLALLQGKLQNYEQRFRKQEQGRSISLEIQEEDLYEAEGKDVVLRVLEKELHSMEQDLNLKMSRKYHILRSICEKNARSHKGEQIEAELREILNGEDDLNRQKKRRLNELGFQVEDGKHYKIVFRGDRRYMFTLSKSISDHRSNRNAVSGVINTLFGY